MFFSVLNVFYFIGLLVEVAIRMPYHRRNKKNTITDDRLTLQDRLLLTPLFLSMQLIPLLYVLTPWLDFADYRLPVWASLVGSLIFVAAWWLFWRAHADLGRNWSASLQIREGHLLVTQGIYRHIRRPMCASQWLWAIVCSITGSQDLRASWLLSRYT